MRSSLVLLTLIAVFSVTLSGLDGLQTLMAVCGARTFTAGVIIAVLVFGFVFLYNFFTQNSESKGLRGVRSPLVDYQPKQYSIHILTWNVGGKKPKNVEKMLPLLGINETFKPDIVAIGIQEIVEIGINIDTFFSVSKWANAIEDELFPQNYARIDSVRNKGMNLFVYALQDHTEFIEQSDRVEKRINPSSQIITHKSGQSVRFQFYLVSLAFTNAHLDAGEGKVGLRTKNYHSIVEEPFSDQKFLTKHDYHFWFGDLNFRIKDLPPQTIMDRIDLIRQKKGSEESKKMINDLLVYDELKSVMQRNIAFGEYSEPEITFLPTYKLYPYSDDYDLDRNPSYCDRILYKTLPKDNYKKLELINLRYDADSINRMSDHRPVTALYLIKA